MITFHEGTGVPISAPDVYFREDYGAAAAIQEGGRWRLYEALDGAWQMPLVIRPVDDRSSDAISPYGYAGAYADPGLAPQDISRAWDACMSAMREAGIISVLLRHSPLVAQAMPMPAHRSVVVGHPTRLVPLSTPEAAWGGLAGRCRTAVRKSAALGYRAQVRHAAVSDITPGSAFRTLYESTMARRAAAVPYFLASEYYEVLLNGLGPDLLVAETLDGSGTTVAAALLMRHGDRLHYHLSGSSPEHAPHGVNNAMLWEACRWAAESGIRSFHLGGGLAVDDPLYRFKKSFGGEERYFSMSGLIVDADAYATHSAARRQPRAAAEDSTDGRAGSTFFPAYRGGR